MSQGASKVSDEDRQAFLEVVGETVPVAVYFNLLSEHLIGKIGNNFRSRSDFERDESLSHVENVQRFVDRELLSLWNRGLYPTDRVRVRIEEIAPARPGHSLLGWVSPKFAMRWVVEPLPESA